MKEPYLFLLAGLLAGGGAHAQQPWQPFRPGLTYQYHEAATSGDTTYVLRLVGAGTVAAGTTSDTLYRFPGMVRPIKATAANCGTSQRELPDNLFGATLLGRPQSVFVLGSPNGRTLTLRPRYALGQSWPTGLPGLTASVSSRAVQPVLGGAADSVVAISLSDGQTLRLSKSYGLLEGPSLDGYFNGRYRRRTLTLTAIAERALGSPLTGPYAIFDFQPGDVFQYTNYGYCGPSWKQDSVLTRQTSATGDVITYTIKRWLIERIEGGRYCTSQPGTTYSASTTTLVISSATAPIAATSRLLNGWYTLPAFSKAAEFGGRPTYVNRQGQSCPQFSPDSAGLGFNGISYDRYGTGLGLAAHYYSVSSGNGAAVTQTSILTAYRKGSQSWGTFFQRAALLAARAVQPAATTTAFPTPFAESLTVAFVLDRPQPVGVTLHDALGRLVRELPAQALAPGARQLLLPTAELPAGLYTLHLHFAGESRSEVLKVVK